MNKIDIKTWVIIILAAIVVCMALFGKGGGGDTALLEQQIKERELENKKLEQRIEERQDSIVMYNDSIAYYLRMDSLHTAVIQAQQEIIESSKKDIAFLKSKIKNVDKTVNELTDEKRLEAWRRHFEQKGVK